jgi:putative transposase
MMEEDAAALCGHHHERGEDRAAYRWGRAQGKVGFHGGKIAVERPRARARSGVEVALPSWETALAEDWLGQWAMNLVLINVSTRKFGRAVRLPGGDVPAMKGDGRSKSAVSRRFVALSAERVAEWMATDLSRLDLVAIQIDGIHVKEELLLVAAVGIDAGGETSAALVGFRGGEVGTGSRGKGGLVRGRERG